MFVGNKDELADVKDNKWALEQMKNAAVHYQEYNLGHMTFMIGKDMSYFFDVIDILG